MQSLVKQEETLRLLGVESEKNSKLEGIATSILDFLASEAPLNRPEMKTSLHDVLISKIYDARTQPVDATAQFISLAPERRYELEDIVLASLRYTEMEDRQGRIAESYESTFEWAFHDSKSETQDWHNLRTWLEDNDQLYWITGKAGSGKSTLMKYICHPVPQQSPSSLDAGSAQVALKTARRRQPYLDKWAGGKELLTASFYFWNSGTQLQMDITGLLRSLLYQVLQQKRDLIPHVLPSRWESLSILGWQSGAWKDLELQSALEAFVKASTITLNYKVCFFIDGLDEFSGPHDGLIKFVQNLAHGNFNAKFCIASRPWVVFEDAFMTKPHLKLENLTYNDIKHYVSSNFRSHSEFPKYEVTEPEFASQLIEDIISKASGAFLWVHLVVASLLSGLTFGDRVSDLQRRLDYLPPDLENLYKKMLKSLDPFYLEHAAQLIMMMEASQEPLPLLLFYFADNMSAELLANMPAHQMSDNIMALYLDAMVRRLKSRWKGLLEVERAGKAGTPSERAQQTVQYLHRTVKEFVQSKEVHISLQSSLKSPYDPHMSLCVGHCAYLKALPSAPSPYISLCLSHGAQVLPTSEENMLRVLDKLVPPWPVLIRAYMHFEEHEPKNSSYLESERFEGVKDADTKFSRNVYLSLVVKHGVTAYIRARAEEGCLVEMPCGSRSLEWPLLLDAVRIADPKPEVVQCLLNKGVNPNFRLTIFSKTNTPWEELLERISTESSGRIVSTRCLDHELCTIVKAMVMHSADLKGGSSRYLQTYTNRFGRKEVAWLPIFNPSFFKELEMISQRPRSLPSRLRSSIPKDTRKWYHRLRGPQNGSSIQGSSHKVPIPERKNGVKVPGTNRRAYVAREESTSSKISVTGLNSSLLEHEERTAKSKKSSTNVKEYVQTSNRRAVSTPSQLFVNSEGSTVRITPISSQPQGIFRCSNGSPRKSFPSLNGLLYFTAIRM